MKAIALVMATALVAASAPPPWSTLIHHTGEKRADLASDQPE